MRYSILWCVLGAAVCFAGVSSYGERVFVADRGGAKVVALGVDENMEFSFLKRWSFITGSTYGLGPLDLAVDEARGIMFVSFETVSSAGEKMAACRIALIDINTYEHIKDIEFAEADDFGGLAYDSQRERLYAVERDTNLLYVLKWTPQTLSLEYEAVVELSSISYACAIVVDGDSAYITEFRYRGGSIMGYYDHIKEYDISEGWRYVRTIPNQDKSTCLAYDSAAKIFYSGAYDYQGSYQHMIKHVMDPNEVIVKDIGNCMIDGDVDAATGYVYITTYNGAGMGEWGNVQVWDTSEWTDDPNQAIAPVGGYVYDPNGPSSEMLYGPAGVLFVGYDARPMTLGITKDDGLNEEDPNDFVLPEDEIVYTITIDPNNTNHEWLTVTDVLPAGVDLETMPPDPNYDPQTHTYTWELGPLSATDDPVVLTLTVTVNDRAEPMGMLVNEVIAESDVGFGIAWEQTPVACFGGDIIYVAAAASEGGNGTNWQLAYNKLSDALNRAEQGCGVEEVWIARGKYHPGPLATDTFDVPDSVSVYGGFAGNEPSIEQRNFVANPTILSGYIRTINDIEQRNETVVTMGNDSLLDGVIVKEADWHGVKGTNVDYSVGNCVIWRNGWDGIYCVDGALTVSWSEVKDNAWHGVYHESANSMLTVYNSRIHDNTWDGVLADSSHVTIKNSSISGNGSDGDYYGLNLLYPASMAVVHNNTIAHNMNEGVAFVGESIPDVRNCILWGNNGEGSQLVGLEVYEIYFSCIPDCNDVNPEGNINEDPRFAYSYPEYGLYHLASDSNCIDAGDPNLSYGDQVDIDGDDRIYGTYVDIGADEAVCGEVSNTSDVTADGIINFKDFSILADAWLSSDPNEPGITTDPNFIGQSHYRDPASFVNWDSRCNFDADYVIDLADLEYFVIDGYWLWQACWRESWEGLWMMEAGMMQSTFPLESVAFEPVLPQAAKVQPTIDEQYAHAKDVTEELEDLWANDEEIKKVIDKKDWKKFMDRVYDWLSVIEAVYDEQ